MPPVLILSPHLTKQNGVPVNVFSLMGTGKSHSELNMLNREIWKNVSMNFGEELSYQLGSMCWCVVMQNISVINMAELRPLTVSGFPQITSLRSVYL
ncbi:hypothetical protein TNCV_2975881 [Trichonephila clavipes]|nr:hypothetical protein TNCV_2975881 [Trichonephila clavipes]